MTAIQTYQRTDFDIVADMVGKTLSDTSRRVYFQTYRLWYEWCENIGVVPVDVNFANVREFLLDCEGTRQTRQRHLSALRKLGQVMAIIDGSQAKQNYELLKMLKAPSHDKQTEQRLSAERERSKRALSTGEAYALMRVFTGGNPIERRNAAMIATLLLTGLRRAELAALQWRDVNFETGVVYVRNGKGGKPREVPILGDYAIVALKAWRRVQGKKRKFVFCSVLKGGRLRQDLPTHADTVWRVVKKAGQIAGIDWTPHDGRRTVITAVAADVGLKAAQQIAGHQRESTTLLYAGKVEAAEIRRRAKIGYGAVTAHDRELLEGKVV